MTIIAWLIFIVVQILFVPLAIVGASVVAYKQIWVSKQLGVSQTAIEVINGRWTMHIFDLREDELTAKLNALLPNNSTIGLWLALFPLYLSYKLTGKRILYPTLPQAGHENISHLVISRTIYIDALIKRHVGNIEQFVMMGAGLDTRAYRDLNSQEVKCFELDQSTTQQLKRESLKKAGISTDHVTFVEVDFSLGNWFDQVVQSGYDPQKKTLFLWEGVTLYLSEASVRNTMKIMEANSAEGSVIVADIYARSFVIGDYTSMMKASLPVLDLTDEGLGFGIDFSDNPHDALRTFVEREGASLGTTYFLGEHTEKGAYSVVAEIFI